MNLRYFPTRIDEIKPAWLGAVLHVRGALPHGQILRCDASRLGQQGMTSDTYRLTLHYDGD
ncbi:MAG TPA: hypothetical protein VFG30_05975, partial [Polyangiales bacterium]|nr:hypothetical protein [Polyangiales bacterium]